uniref:Uncharacterized protein n=1 Tax=Anguilla anguilla TaxID=7936 RepID=A0A0E9P8X1_ANGAN
MGKEKNLSWSQDLLLCVCIYIFSGSTHFRLFPIFIP